MRAALLFLGTALSVTPLATPALALAGAFSLAVGNPWSRLTGSTSAGPAIGAKREAMSVSLAVVFVLNAVALYIFSRTAKPR
ncbi:MAG: hypothetical protein ACT4P6_00485 [Gemmatimonadaceae bacterium]